MKISKNMQKALNNQITLEASASNSYMAMASWCEVTGYEGGASFFSKWVMILSEFDISYVE